MTPQKCPNPACPFVFDPSQVPPGAVLACPRCGLRFVLGPTAVSPPPPAPPSASPELSFPSPRRQAVKPPRGPDRPENVAVDPDEPPAAPRFSVKTLVLACLAVLLLGGAALTYLVVRTNRGNDAGPLNAPTAERPYRSKSGLFTVTDTEGGWARQERPESQEAAAQLWMRGSPRSRGVGPAELVVAVIDAGADAERHVLNQMSDGYERETLPDDPPTGVTRLRLTYPDADDSANKLVAFAAVPAGGKLVVAYATCAQRDAGYWDPRLSRLVGSLRAGR